MIDEPRRGLEQGCALAEAGPICPECLGRAFAKHGRGLPNPVRGEALGFVLEWLGCEVREGRCWICDDLFRRLAPWVDEAERLVEGVEFETYLFGVRLPTRLEEMERYARERFDLQAAESAKHAFNRAAGMLFNARFPTATVAFVDPHVSFLVDVPADRVTMHVASLYIRGRYRKWVRGIPQTKWPCRTCRGRGCDACRGTGQQYQETVEGWVASPFVAATEARGARFHGAGREDVDARMLGPGRPFVLELLAPRRRHVPLGDLVDAVNRSASGRVEILDVARARRQDVEIVKETRARKRYRAVVEFDRAVSPEALDDALRFLVGTIAQRTPHRVAHRRSDRVRFRRLFEATGTLISPHRADVAFGTEGGLYVKELVSGDGGRSEPSLAGRLRVPARVVALDVTDVLWPDGAFASMDDGPAGR